MILSLRGNITCPERMLKAAVIAVIIVVIVIVVWIAVIALKAKKDLSPSFQSGPGEETTTLTVTNSASRMAFFRIERGGSGVSFDIRSGDTQKYIIPLGEYVMRYRVEGDVRVSSVEFSGPNPMVNIY